MATPIHVMSIYDIDAYLNWLQGTNSNFKVIEITKLVGSFTEFNVVCQISHLVDILVTTDVPFTSTEWEDFIAQWFNFKPKAVQKLARYFKNVKKV